MLTALRLVCLVLWALIAAILAPAAFRVVRGRYTSRDEHHSFKFFTALLFVGSLSRWLFAPEDQALFFCVYVLTAALAIYALLLIYQYRSRP